MMIEAHIPMADSYGRITRAIQTIWLLIVELYRRYNVPKRAGRRRDLCRFEQRVTEIHERHKGRLLGTTVLLVIKQVKSSRVKKIMWVVCPFLRDIHDYVVQCDVH